MKYLYNHTSQETAYVVKDYPWGYRLRTTIRYWIESKVNHGQRFCRQTINPKTGLWCAPKYGTYSPILILYLNENDHVHVDGLSHWADEDRIKWFKNVHEGFLDQFQKEELKMIIAKNKVMQNVTWTIEPCPIGAVSLTSQRPEDVAKREAIMKHQEENKREQAEEIKRINRAIAYEASKVIL